METTKSMLNFLLNFLFIGIPETFVFIFLVLFLMKENHYFKAKNLKSAIMDILIVGTLPTALFLNSLYYFTNLDLTMRMFLNSIIYFIFINHLIKFSIKDSLWDKHLKSYKPTERHLPEKYRTKVNTDTFLRKETSKYIFTIENNLPKVKYKNKKSMYLSVVFMIIISFTLGIFTSLYLQYVINFDMKTLSINIIDSILLVYPTLIIVAFVVYLKYIYVNMGNTTIFRIWKNNKKFRITTYIQGITTFVSSILVYLFIIRDDLINTLDSTIVFRASLLAYILLIAHVIVPWILIFREEMLKYKLQTSKYSLK